MNNKDFHGVLGEMLAGEGRLRQQHTRQEIRCVVGFHSKRLKTFNLRYPLYWKWTTNIF